MLTLIDAINQFWQAVENNDRRSLTSAGLTYGYLCHVWNGCGRPALFRRQNNLICAELCISKPTLDRHRQILKNAGIIDFYSKGKGDANITYKILEYTSSKERSKNILLPTDKKEKNFTTCVTSPVTTHDAYKQSKSTELFISINGEVKNFYYLKNLFESDEGLLMSWRQKGMPAEKFSDALEQWMIMVHASPYHDFQKARNHFLFWMPNYKTQKQQSDGKTNRGTFTKTAHEDSAYAGGL